MACFLEHFVQLISHVFPKCKAIRLYDHATPDSGIVGKAAFYYKIIVPLGVIFLPGCNNFAHTFKWECTFINALTAKCGIL
jgi:hypothetical protein